MKDEAQVTRFIVEHKHTPAKEDPAPKPRPRKQDPRIARATRLKDQVELLEEKIREAKGALESHPLVAEIEEASLAAEWVEREIARRDVQIHSKRRAADARYTHALFLRDSASKLLAEAAGLTDAGRALELEAAEAEAENKRTAADSRCNGPHKRLGDLQKDYNARTHRIAKQGREAERRAEKLRKKLAILLEELAPVLDSVGD